MAELLTVVAILAILMGLVGISVYNYVRDLTLTEYDNAAKSIYIAAQNSIADLQASGEWAEEKDAYASGEAHNPTAERTDDGQEADVRAADDAHYYYVTAQFARDNGILPAGSIEDQVWNGSFIIEYRYDTAKVYGVFYTEGDVSDLGSFYSSGIRKTDPPGADPPELKSVRDRSTRLDNDQNIIVGYYGGEAARPLDSVKLKEPIVSAGRSPILGVTDPNLTESSLETRTLVTIEKAASAGTTPQLKLMVYKEGALVKAEVVASTGLEDASEAVTLSGTGKTTYSIDLAKLKANAAASTYLTEIGPGDEYRVTARVTTSKKLCRPAYGYGTGIWPDENEDVIFTSNIIADYEKEADLYVYRDEVNWQGGDVVFNLENWYNDLTKANEDLYYRIEANERISINSIHRFENGTIGQQVNLVNNDYYEYPYDENGKKNVAHRVSFKIEDIASVPDGTVFDIKVTAYRKGTFEVPGNAGKTLTIHVRVLNQRPFGYHVRDHGSYAEVVVTAGNTDANNVEIRATSGGVVSDESSTAYKERTNGGQNVVLKSIPAGGSVSIKYFKTDMSITLDETSFQVQQ